MGSRTIITTVATALLASLAATDGQAAQDPGSGAEIVVEAPRTVTLPPPQSPPQRSAFTGAPVVTTKVKISALYGDLDLARPEHAARLMMRLDRVAHDACGYLDRLLPISSDATCVRKAIAQATPAAEAAIAAAQK
jgi:UrcA family protein